MPTTRDRVRHLGPALGAVLVVWALSESLLLDVPASATRLECVLVALALTLPTLAIRRWPVAAAALVAIAYLVNVGLGARPVGGVAGELVLAFALYCACAHRTGDDWRRWAGAAIGGAGLAAGWVLYELGVGEFATLTTPVGVYIAAVVVAGVAPGMALRDRRGEVLRLRREVEVLAASVSEHVDEAVEAERDAMDRSLARIVTHLVEEIRVLAADARQALARDAHMAAAVSRRMVAVSGSAVDQLRETVGVLHAAPPATTPPETPAARRRPWPGAADAAALAAPWALLAAFGVADQLLAPDLPLDVTAWGMSFRVEAPPLGQAAGILLAVLTPLPLLARRRLPAAAVAATMAFVVARTWHGDLSSVTFAQTFIGMTAAFVGAAWARTRTEALVAGAAALLGTAASWALEQAVFSPLQYGYMVAALSAGWAVGWALRGEFRASTALRRETATLTRRRNELADRAVAAERRRVARELHDVIGHGLSLIGVQAGAAQVFAERDEQRADEALAHVEAAAAGTLSELRMLRELLSDPELDATGRPLTTVRRLIDDAVGAGQAVRAEVDPRIDAVPAPVGAVAVRVVQEALTNARKHASESPADVAVQVVGDRVRIQVRTEGAAPPPSPEARSGHGLAGMAERVAAVGGALEAGPAREGGWLVSAELPLTR